MHAAGEMLFGFIVKKMQTGLTPQGAGSSMQL